MDKKNIVVFGGDYYPYPSQNGVCLQNLITGWKNYANITVIAYNQDNGEKYRTIDGIKYVFINSPSNKLYNKFRFDKSRKAKFILGILRIWRGLKTALFWLRYDGNYYRKCIRETNKLVKKGEADVILAACYPFSAIYAAYKCNKKSGIEYITYILDVNSEAKNLRKFCLFPHTYKKRDIVAEMNILRYAKMNFLSEGFVYAKMFDYVKQRGVPYKIVGFPLLSKKVPVKTQPSNEITLFYAGAFVKGVREPYGLMKLFSNERLKNVKLILCTIGDCQEELASWAKQYDNVEFKGGVERNVANSFADNADILINVSNKNQHQIPSKIFEYFQRCKPIVNLYYDDKQKNMFAGYPLTLHIQQENISEADVDAFIKFCNEAKGMYEDINTVLENYKEYSIEYLQNLFLQEI